MCNTCGNFDKCETCETYFKVQLLSLFFSFNFVPLLLPSLSLFSSIKVSSLSFLSKALSWWWSSSFHGLFPSGWHLVSFIFRCNSMVENHHWRTSLKLKDPASIEASQASFRQFNSSFLMNFIFSSTCD